MLYTKLHLFIVIEKFINHLVNIKQESIVRSLVRRWVFTNHLVNIKLISYEINDCYLYYLQIT